MATLLKTTTLTDIDAYGYNNWYKMKVEVYLNSQTNTADKCCSNITIKRFFGTQSNSAGWYSYKTPTLTSSISVNGGSYGNSSSSVIKNLEQDNKGNWVQFGSWTGDINHKEDGTQSINVKLAYTSGTTSSYVAKDATLTTGIFSLPTIPRGGILNDIPDFDVDTGFIFNATKPLDTSYRKLVIKDGDNVLNTIYEEDLENDKVYKLNDDINVIYDIMKNSNDYIFNFDLFTYIDGNYETQLGEVSSKSAKGIIINANPVINKFGYEDTNQVVVNLTGDNKKFILGYSLAKYIINEEDKGITYKGASISEYFVKKNTEWISIKDLNYPINSEPFVITNSELGVRLVDSRQNFGEVSINANNINNYIKPSFNNIVIQRDSGSTDVKVNGNIKYWNGNFGLGENTLVYIQYRVKEKDGEYGNWLSLKNKVNVVNGNVNINNLSIYSDGEFNNFELGHEYYIQLKVIDGINENKLFNEVLGKEIYIDDGRVLDSYYKGKNGYKYAINQIVDPDGAELQVGGKISSIDGKIGEFKLSNDTFTTNIYANDDYSQEDLEQINNDIINGKNFTEEEIRKYDLNGDGIINVADMVLLESIVKCNVSKTQPGILEINNKNPLKTILLKDKDGNEIVNINMTGIKVNNTEVGGKQVGDIVITSTNSNPSLIYGGEWELIDKQFKNVYEYKSGTAIATLTSLSSLGVRMTRTGHLVHLDCNANIKANLTDTTVNVCTLKPAVLGFTGELTDRAMFFCGFSDGGNNMIQFAMNAKTFILESLDVVGDDSHKVSSGAAIYWSQTIIADNFTQLADSYCDKFYWKKIS